MYNKCTNRTVDKFNILNGNWNFITNFNVENKWWDFQINSIKIIEVING